MYQAFFGYNRTIKSLMGHSMFDLLNGFDLKPGVTIEEYRRLR
jgi:hypothetical protein